MRQLITIAVASALLAGCATSRVSADSPLGSERRPVRADMPNGQRAYLDRLRCADGAAPRYHRVGNVGVGAYGNITDLYDVRCEGSVPAESAIYMDMYFPGYFENQPVPGFTIVPR